MSLLNTSSKYGLVSRTIHWLIVLAIPAQWLLAEAAEESDHGSKMDFNALALHQSIGLAVLALALFRLAWRVLNPTPAWPADLRPWEIKLARLVHFAFYVLLFAIPLTGWALSSAEQEPLRFFNWFEVPGIDLASEETMEDIHELLFNVLVALAALHVLGAAKHWLTGRARRRGIPAT